MYYRSPTVGGGSKVFGALLGIEGTPACVSTNIPRIDFILASSCKVSYRSPTGGGGGKPLIGALGVIGDDGK